MKPKKTITNDNYTIIAKPIHCLWDILEIQETAYQLTAFFRMLYSNIHKYKNFCSMNELAETLTNKIKGSVCSVKRDDYNYLCGKVHCM